MSFVPKLTLNRIRALGCPHNVMGPTAGLILADLGAEVIHSPGSHGQACPGACLQDSVRQERLWVRHGRRW